MKKQIYQEMELNRLTPNPHNPRKRFAGPEFEDLVKSILKKGVLQPILARPMDGAGLEIVFGERRWRASLAAAEQNGGPEGKTIPTMVRELSDGEAFDLMCIENLQREDLTELEEARGFKIYVDKRGKDSISDLADRTGIDPRYIRRRLAVLSLPRATLRAWEKGDVKFGHLEQLCRLKDQKEIREYTKKIVQWGGSYTIGNLRDDIESRAPELKHAKFDLEKAGCPSCRNNSDIQQSLFELSSLKGAHCLHPKCFKRNQNNFLQANWKKTGYRKSHGTNGFRFRGDVDWSDFHSFYEGDGADLESCKKCDFYVTLLKVTGSVDYGRVCMGDKACYNHRLPGGASDGDGSACGGKKRGAWHGEYFREQFYQQALPVKLREVPVDADVSAAVMLFALLKSNDALHEWFMERNGMLPEDKYHTPFLSNEAIWKIVSGMDALQAKEALKEASVMVVTLDREDTESRRAIADHVGISLEKEWRITEEYLDKKTIPEIRAIGENFGVFEQPAAKTFLYETLLKKRGSFKSCKKGELKRIFLESGVDLSGVVPEEVLGRTGAAG